MNNKIVACLKCVPALLMLIIIFHFSDATSSESSQESFAITKAIIEITNIKLNDNSLLFIEGIIRKIAHFLEYFCLGSACCLALSSFPARTKTKCIIISIFCIVYAISDEVHQYFVPGRACRIQDILLDSAGAIFAVAFWWIFTRFIYTRSDKIC